MQQRRSRETESIFSQQQKNRVRKLNIDWRFDERRHDTEVPEKRLTILNAEQCMGGGGWLSYDERRRNPATREILMRPPRRMNLREQEQRDREREVRNEGAS
ncbi:hypothetical protein YC2023_083216 [Brassica napus]